MKTKDIGQRLVELCKEGKNMESIDTLYAEDVESIEAVRRKNIDWGEKNTIHAHSAEGPYPHGEDRFAVRFTYDITNKPSGERMKLDEIGLFTVANGKIVREEFFYPFG